MKKFKRGDKVYVEAEYIREDTDGFHVLYVPTGTGKLIDAKFSFDKILTKDSICLEVKKRQKKRKKRGEK